jgi:hypothetical protein
MEIAAGLRVIPPLLLTMVLDARAGSAQENASKLLQDFEKRFPATQKNSAAEEVGRQAIALGVDWDSGEDAEHPTKDDAGAYNQAAFGSWLNSQLKTSDDFIAPPPAKLQEFLAKHQAPLWELTGRLEQDAPDWGYDLRDKSHHHPEIGLTVRVIRVLVAAALVEERAGHHVEAEQLLEASWSLVRSFSQLPDSLSQVVLVGLAKLQAGALRKMSQPSFAWIERVSSDRFWQARIDSFQSEPFVQQLGSDLPLDEAFFEARVRGWRRIADNLREISPCKASKLSDDEIGQPIYEELRKIPSDGENDPEKTAQVFRDIAAPNLGQMLRRSASLAVDRELTAKILELRQEKAADRKGRWPEKLVDNQSRVCPDASYEYQLRGQAMMIRFKGGIAQPDAPALVLPLSFEVRAPSQTPTKTPTRTPLPSPTPTPAANP